MAFKPCIGRNGRGYEVERSPALSMGGGVTSDTRPCVVQPAIAIQERAGAERGGPGGKGYNTDGVAYTLEARHHVQATAHTLRAEGFDASEDGTGRGTPLVPVGFAQNQRNEVRTMDAAGALAAEPGMKQQTYIAGIDPYNAAEADTASSLGVNCGMSTGRNGARQGLVVRRLLPVECERLQGFPDHWTAITYRGKPAADGPRYKALGNSMACNVMSWIGQRIEGVLI